jgi:hypothetical protein
LDLSNFRICPILAIWTSLWKIKGIQPAIKSLIWLHDNAGWHGFILVAKFDHFLFQQGKG